MSSTALEVLHPALSSSQHDIVPQNGAVTNSPLSKKRKREEKDDDESACSSICIRVCMNLTVC